MELIYQDKYTKAKNCSKDRVSIHRGYTVPYAMALYFKNQEDIYYTSYDPTQVSNINTATLSNKLYLDSSLQAQPNSHQLNGSNYLRIRFGRTSTPSRPKE